MAGTARQGAIESLPVEELQLVELRIAQVLAGKKGAKKAMTLQYRNSGESGSTTLPALIACSASYSQVRCAVPTGSAYVRSVLGVVALAS